MSFKAMAWATEQEITTTSPQSHLLLILASFANEQNECYPSINTLIKKTRLSEKTVRKCIKELLELELISDADKTSFFGSKVYILNVDLVGDTPSKSTPPSKNTGGSNFTSPPLVDLPKGGSNFTSPPLVDLPPNPINNIREPVNKPKNNKAKFDPLAVELPSNVDSELWIAFVEMRKAIKKPISTEYTAKLLIKSLIEFGNLANQSLEYSIKNNYQDLYLPKQNNQPQNNFSQPISQHEQLKQMAQNWDMNHNQNGGNSWN